MDRRATRDSGTRCRRGGGRLEPAPGRADLDRDRRRAIAVERAIAVTDNGRWILSLRRDRGSAKAVPLAALRRQRASIPRTVPRYRLARAAPASSRGNQTTSLSAAA